MVSQRRQLLDYVKRKDVARYQRIIEKLDPPLTPSPGQRPVRSQAARCARTPAPVSGCRRG